MVLSQKISLRISYASYYTLDYEICQMTLCIFDFCIFKVIKIILTLLCKLKFDILIINIIKMFRQAQNELENQIQTNKKHQFQKNQSRAALVQHEQQLQNSSKTYFISPQKQRNNLGTTKDVSTGKKITQSNQDKPKQKNPQKHQKIFKNALVQAELDKSLDSPQMQEQKKESLKNNHNQIKPFCVRHNMKQIEFICTAPECNNYRQLCADCATEDLQIHYSTHEKSWSSSNPNSPKSPKQNQNSGSFAQLSSQYYPYIKKNKNKHKRYHIPVEEAYNETKKSIQELYKGLRGIQFKIRDQIQMNINNYLGYDDVSIRLDKIRELIEKKINDYKTDSKKVYQKKIKEKLQNLYEATQSSIHFLDQQRLKINQKRSIQFLKPFYTNDLHYDIRYYESYLNEVLQKKAKQFKTGLDDKIFEMLVTFQQNLQKIFKNEKQQESCQKLHAFIGDGYGLNKLYQLKDNSQPLRQGQLQSEQVFIEKSQNEWDGPVASIFFQQKDSFYLFGQGSKESSLIQRYTPSSSEHRILGNMEVKRKNFSVCLLNNEIFIIGGQNQKEGTLVKCEKYVPSINKIYLISSLNQRSAKHSITTFKDKFILKFGGTYHMDFFSEIGQSSKQLQYDQTQGKWKNKKYLALDSHYYSKSEIYSLETQEWQVLSFNFQMNSRLNQQFLLGINPIIFKSGTQELIILAYQNYANGFQYYFRSYNQQKQVQPADQENPRIQQESGKRLSNAIKRQSKNKSKSNQRFRDKSKKKIKEIKDSIVNASNHIKCKRKRFFRYQLKILHDDKEIKQIKIQSKERSFIPACFYTFPFKDYSRRNVVTSLVLTDPIKSGLGSNQQQPQIFTKVSKDMKGLSDFLNQALPTQNYKSTDFQRFTTQNQISGQKIQSNQQLMKEYNMIDSPRTNNKFVKEKDKEILSQLVKLRHFPI